MKGISFVFVFGLIVSTSSAQKFNISCKRNNIIYVGWQNPISVLVNGYSCDSILLKTKNGRFDKIGCHYNYFPDSVSDTKIEVYVIKNKKQRKVGESYLRVRNLPLPRAHIGGFSGGEISKGNFLAQMGIGNYYSEIHIEISYLIKSFIVLTIRDRKVLFQQSNDGNMFSATLKSAMQQLLTNDRVSIINIVAQGPDGKEVYLNPIEFTIY